MKTGGGGGIGRQVQDASFFIGVLRGKMNDARAEVERLRAEIERHDKDVSQQGHLERTYEAMLQVCAAMLEGGCFGRGYFRCFFLSFVVFPRAGFDP